jgi:ATP-binding cassette, subfamily B, bacterial
VVRVVRVEIRGAGVVRGGRRLLGGADLVLEPGTLTVVTGAEATTLLELAAGLAPAEGSVRFDGVDVRRLGDEVLSSSVAVVTRRPFVTAGSIRDNVTLGAGADPREAMRIAALPEDGDPGEYRHQVAIARAVSRRPRLIVLDDATTDLEPDVELRVLRNLAATGITVVVTTTRPVPFADQVVHLSEGRRPHPVATGRPVGATV